MAYAAPINEIVFALDQLAGLDAVTGLERYREATAETRRAVLTEAGRLCDGILAPLNVTGDRHPARLEGGEVILPPGFCEGYGAIRDGGWIGVAADPAHGGMGLPQTLAIVVNEMMSGACLALANTALLSAGQIDLLEAHADDRLKALYLPRLIAGDWCGTMNLTEPQAGSDLAAIRCRAEPRGDGTFRLEGHKIYITFGEHDAAANIVHAVLARLPDAPPGVRGLSLFLCPKFIPDDDGNPATRNAVRCIGLERKMGQHGAPTCVMAYEGATAWLVGEPHQGIRGMFTMMNNARLSVAVQGLGAGEAAFQVAMRHAAERRQGRTPLGDGPIRDHADVRRMLMTIRTRLDAARFIAYACGVAGDMARGGAGDDHAARWAFLTPIAKAFCTDVGCEAASLAQQVLGGAGYIADYEAEQLARDIRIAPIYEGTNGIQAMDLVGRKLADGGAAARALMDEMEGTDGMAETLAPLRAATGWMLGAGTVDRQAGAAPYLRAWALGLGAWSHRRAAALDPARAPRTAFFLAQEAPMIAGLCTAATAGADALYEAELDRMMA
jgi:alkylation response protein AidB-like acyl-CoA dehydrogenase